MLPILGIPDIAVVDITGARNVDRSPCGFEVLTHRRSVSAESCHSSSSRGSRDCRAPRKLIALLK
jgi:hypothetical protein